MWHNNASHRQVWLNAKVQPALFSKKRVGVPWCLQSRRLPVKGKNGRHKENKLSPRASKKAPQIISYQNTAGNTKWQMISHKDNIQVGWRDSKDACRLCHQVLFCFSKGIPHPVTHRVIYLQGTLISLPQIYGRKCLTEIAVTAAYPAAYS